ncbi:MAG: EamA family transporter, partial [Bacteroidota bacterium]
LIWVMQRGGISHALKTQTPFLQIARSLILVTEIAIFILAFRYLPLGDVTAIASAAPLVVLAFAVIFLGEKVGIHRWSAVAIGLIGMIMIARPGFGSFGS